MININHDANLTMIVIVSGKEARERRGQVPPQLQGHREGHPQLDNYMTMKKIE